MRIDVMKFVFVGFAMIGILLNSGNVRAAEQTVTLDVKSLTCSLCPVTVRKALEKTDGVTKAIVSYEQHQAVIIYDDEIVDIPILIETTTNAGFPSSVPEDREAGYE